MDLINDAEIEIDENIVNRLADKLAESANLTDERKLSVKFYRQSQLYYAMQYRISYLLWKLKKLWPVINFMALNFHYVLMTFIVGCSIYYSVAFVWLLWMCIFMFLTWTK